MEGLAVKEGDMSTPLVLACLVGCSQQVLQLALALTHQVAILNILSTDFRYRWICPVLPGTQGPMYPKALN